jgi:hypothetical protein
MSAATSHEHAGERPAVGQIAKAKGGRNNGGDNGDQWPRTDSVRESEEK